MKKKKLAFFAVVAAAAAEAVTIPVLAGRLYKAKKNISLMKSAKEEKEK